MLSVDTHIHVMEIDFKVLKEFIEVCLLLIFKITTHFIVFVLGE